MIKQHVFSFRNAILGLKWALLTQKNFRIHLAFSLIAIIGGFVFHVSNLEFLIIITLIGTGLAVELVNTAIEEAIDAIHKDWTEEIKVAKDVSASAMLIFSFAAILIASIIFIPKIIAYFRIY